MIKLQDMEKVEMIDDISQIEEFENEMMIVSGFALGARNMFAKDTAVFRSVRYSESYANSAVLENNGMTRKINEYAFFDKPDPTPRKKWEH